MRLIDADALEKRMEGRLNRLRKEFGSYDHYSDGFEEGCVAVEDAETIDPESLRPKGRWISVESVPHMTYKCSACKERWGYGAMLHMNHRPNCGAKMEE